MTIPFWCLLLAVLAPYVLAGVGTYYKQQQFGSVDNSAPRAQAAHLEGAGARAWAAQQNAWEALAVFTPAVLVAHVAGADAQLSALAAVVFVAARASHAFCYVTDRPPLRSASFGVGMLCCLALFGLAAAA